MKQIFNAAPIIFLSALLNISFAQNYEVGVSYFSTNEHVEYIHGNLPIILSSPHGGEKKPEDIPDRDCPNCVTTNDRNTQELTRELTKRINDLTGCFPHVIINRLHRSKLDANREIIEAALGDASAEQAWVAYQDFILAANQTINKDFDKGLFIDVHGHGHEIQRLELGYLLSKSNLQLQDADLSTDTFINKSSIKDLVLNNLDMHNLPMLIRGENSLGTIMEEKGYPSVPSAQDPYPMNDESYFSGGYNTVQNGSRNDGTIDAIQIECNQDVRFETTPRLEFADSLAIGILKFIRLNYFGDENFPSCKMSTSKEIASTPLILFYPNPAQTMIYLHSAQPVYEISIVNTFGEEVLKLSSQQTISHIDLSQLNNGVYTILLDNNHNSKPYRIIKAAP